MMRRHLGVLLSLSLALLGVAAPALADSTMHGRVSYEAGGAMVKGTSDTDWGYASVNTLVLPGDTVWADTGALLEVEMSGGTFLRLADKSKAEVVSLPPSGVLRGWTGSFYIQRVSRSTGDFAFQAPACSVAVDRDSHVRIDIVESGATTVSVRWGRATVRTDVGSPVVVGTAKRVYVDPGYLPSVPQGFDTGVEDDFDAWSRERARVMALGTDALPKTYRATSQPLGTADLVNYGEWVYVDSEPYWRPTVVVDYVPYRRGSWSYVPSYGYCWVGDYPFGYVTSHYGRWTYRNNYGWLWTYRDVWGPAWVASVRCGPNFVWSPLDPFDRPIAFGGSSYGGFYDFGSFRFSIFASSYCPVDSLFYGYSYVRPARPGAINVVNGDVNIWNININNSNINLPWTDGRLPVRSYSPRRVVRGPDQLELGQRTVRAVDRINNLETSVGRAQFRAVDRTGMRQQRTTSTRSTDRDAGVRRITADAARQAEGRTLSERVARDVRGPRDAGERAERTARTPDVTGGRTVTREGGDTPSRTLRSRDAAGDTVDRTEMGRSGRNIDRGESGMPTRRTDQPEETASRDLRTRVPDEVSSPEPDSGRNVRTIERDTPDRSGDPDRGRAEVPRTIRLPERSVDSGERGGVDRGEGRVTRERVHTESPVDRTPDRVEAPRNVERTPERSEQAPRNVDRTPSGSPERRSEPSESRGSREDRRSSAVAPERTPFRAAPRTVTLRGSEGRGGSHRATGPSTPDGSRVRAEAPRTSGRSLAERTVAPNSATTPQERVMSAPRMSLPAAREPRAVSVPRTVERSAPRTIETREAPQMRQPRVSAPAPRAIETPQRQVQVPQRQMEMPRREIQMPQRQIEMPRREIQMPQRNIEMPRREVQTPERQIQMPSRGSGGGIADRGSRSVDSGRGGGHRGR